MKQTSEGNGWERVLVDQGQLPGKESLISRRGAPVAGGEGQTEGKKDTRQTDGKGQWRAETDVGCPD